MFYYQNYRSCSVCGQSMKVYDCRKRYCSNACRQKAYRARLEETRFAHRRSLELAVTRSRPPVTEPFDDTPF